MNLLDLKIRVCDRKMSKLFLTILCQILLCLVVLTRSSAQLLPPEEVAALEAIAMKLQIRIYWKNITQYSCSQAPGLNVTIDDNSYSHVMCDCSFSNNTICHVTNVQLKGLNVAGDLPEEFTDLPYLVEINLSRNYIKGTIPSSFSKLPLYKLSISNNRLTGSLPKEIGDITTLEELVFDGNQLEGTLDENLGNLGRLRRLLLSSNNFTGTIPETFGNFKNLTNFRIAGCPLSGKFPHFVGNWTKLTELDVQGTSLEGPLPLTLSLMTSLQDMRVSDLKGPSSSIPDLRNLTMLRSLVLRNCMINGPIPDYIGSLKKLKMIDLSFNKLTDVIPDSIGMLGITYLFLMHNSLSGKIPDWVALGSSKQFLSTPYTNFTDVSYNNFSSSPPVSCQQSSSNLVSSISTSGSSSVSWCLRKNLPCPVSARYSSLFINCGGSAESFEGNEYEEDPTATKGSQFVPSGSKWAYSNTGVFVGNESALSIATNEYGLNVSNLYATARTSPISLKYYGLCLRKGTYNVRLHFAEIMFDSGKTFDSLGERIFDIVIQGKLVEKDFNIVRKANGVGKPIYLDFDGIRVKGSTLEIHLYWSGKGSEAVPRKGVYGPLISAIAVTPSSK